MIVQIVYREFNRKIEDIVRKLRRLNAEIIFTKGDVNSVWINSYNVWREGEEYDVIEGFYDVKIYEMMRRIKFGVSS